MKNKMSYSLVREMRVVSASDVGNYYGGALLCQSLGGRHYLVVTTGYGVIGNRRVSAVFAETFKKEFGEIDNPEKLKEYIS